MKQTNSTFSAQFKAVCRKTILASAFFCGISMMANAQTQDGRDFSIDGFAAYEGVPGTNWYRAGGTTGGAGGKVVKADNYYSTAKTYDAEGKVLASATTGISLAEKSSEAGTSRIEYYDLAGSRLSAPQKGINIVKKVNHDGHVSVKKVIF